jgi:dihydroorotate dehydrogenase electron transfer subunit
MKEHSLHADYYADRALQQTVEVIENVQLARDTYRVRLAAPDIARRIVPGQFLMLRLTGCNDPLIGRPLALYDTILDESGKPVAVDLVYLVKGKLTSRLVGYCAGNLVDLWGPLGNGFRPEPTGHLVMVAGGIGQTPFLALAQEYKGRQFGDQPRTEARAGRITLLYGARTVDLLAGIEDFRNRGVEVRVATDDGSSGHPGLVTDLLADLLAEPEQSRRVVCCGPEPMMREVARVSSAAGTTCHVSLETPMACGIGICFSCVAKVRDESGRSDYKRTCVEGPVFDSELIEWVT